MEQKKFMDKEKFYGVIQEIREIVKDPENLKCTCPNTFCEWYGKCRECVAQHRYYGKHLPVCLQPIIKDKINALAETAELYTDAKGRSTIKDWQYVSEMDNLNKQNGDNK